MMIELSSEKILLLRENYRFIRIYQFMVGDWTGNISLWRNVAKGFLFGRKHTFTIYPLLWANFYTKKGSENPISAANRYLGLSFVKTVKKLGIKHSSRLMMSTFTYDINFLQVFFHILLEPIGNLAFQ